MGVEELPHRLQRYVALDELRALRAPLGDPLVRFGEGLEGGVGGVDAGEKVQELRQVGDELAR